jgi:hypothetical protein
MTRETKIGLLVGLAFIIVLGILIADYSVTSTQPPPAALMTTATDVLASNNAPGTRRVAPLPEHAGDVRVRMIHPFEIEPARPEMGAGRNGGGIVRVGHPGGGQARDLRVEDGPGRIFIERMEAGRADPQQIITPGRDESADSGDDRVDRPVTLSALREYRAEPGDTVFKMARRFLGSGSQEHRDAIVNVNPALRANPDRIIAGEVYRIPLREEAPRDNGAAAPAVPPRPPVAREETVAYVTRPGDSLWKIAAHQCGSGSMAMVERIRELNRDVIRGDVVMPGVTLKLPRRGS